MDPNLLFMITLDGLLETLLRASTYVADNSGDPNVKAVATVLAGAVSNKAYMDQIFEIVKLCVAYGASNPAMQSIGAVMLANGLRTLLKRVVTDETFDKLDVVVVVLIGMAAVLPHADVSPAWKKLVETAGADAAWADRAAVAHEALATWVSVLAKTKLRPGGALLPALVMV